MSHWFPPPTKPMHSPICETRPGLAPLGIAPSMVPFNPSTIPPPSLRSFASCLTHTVSLHFAPAAFPRCASAPGVIKVPQNLEASQRRAWVKQEAVKLVQEKRALERDLALGGGVVEEGPARTVQHIGLWNAILRISRIPPLPRGAKGVTLVATHANGFHKETWEVAFRRLIELTERSDSNIRIENIWVLECVDHGDSALANGDNIPRLADRSDYGRDVANFCLHYLPSHSTIAPPILQRAVKPEGRQSSGNHEGGRKVIGVGHSLGGDAMILCALSYPSIFESLVLSETTLFPAHLSNHQNALLYVGGALGRRGQWPSREEAKQALQKAPLFVSLHPDVFRSYIDHALYDVKGGVKLKCSPESEARQFNELLSMNEAWERLPGLDERVQLHWIMGGRDCASDIVGGPEVARNTVWRRAKNSSNVRIPDAGHLIVQEKPMEYGERYTYCPTRYGLTMPIHIAAQALAHFLQYSSYSHIGHYVKARL
ncbi:Alpha/beta hydrolase family-domain-containing protein [Coprinopsis sp. MPI-PUGE-AT-0042]|nr:Alpha/beta hydrolase family-domain-containing protein [Coprinopsis sp. MPI-PUGE-AT-0042]